MSLKSQVSTKGFMRKASLDDADNKVSKIHLPASC